MWFAHNGERLGTYHGHQGAIWTVDVDPTSTIIASGSADNTIRLWDIRTGRCLKAWEFPTAIKRVEFNEDGTRLLGVTEKRMGHLGTIVVLEINVDVDAEQAEEKLFSIVCHESKATVAGWSYLSKYIIAGHEDGSISQYDAKTGELLYNVAIHELNMQITDLQWSEDRTYCITASKDKTARVRHVSRPPFVALFSNASRAVPTRSWSRPKTWRFSRRIRPTRPSTAQPSPAGRISSFLVAARRPWM